MITTTDIEAPAGVEDKPMTLIERANLQIAESKLARAATLAKRDQQRADFKKAVAPRLVELAKVYQSAGIAVELCVEFPSDDFDDMREGHLAIYSDGVHRHKVTDIHLEMIRVRYISSERQMWWADYLKMTADNLVDELVSEAKLRGGPIAETPPMIVSVRFGGGEPLYDVQESSIHCDIDADDPRRSPLAEIEVLQNLIDEVSSTSSDMYVNDAYAASDDALIMPLALQSEIAAAVVGVLRRKMDELLAEVAPDKAG